jgi:hypothetical protein
MIGSQFLDVHLEAAVSADRPDPFIRPGQFHADRHGQCAAHGAGTPGGKPAVGGLEIVEAGQDHLVLPHIADDDIFPLGQVGQLSAVMVFQQLPLLADAGGDLRLDGRRFSPPGVDLVEPVLPGFGNKGRIPPAV